MRFFRANGMRFAAVLAFLLGTACSRGGSTVTSSADSAQIPAQLVIRAAPSGPLQGAPLRVQPVIEVRDASGNLVTAPAVNVSALLQTGTGTLAGTATVATVAGVATFTNLAVVGSGGDKTLSFRSGGLPTVVAPSIRLPDGPAAKLSFSTPPTLVAVVLQPLAQQPVVQAVDAFDAPVPFSGTVTVQVDSGDGAVAAGGSSPTDAAGVARFAALTLSAKAGAAGTVRLSFSAPGLASLRSAAIAVSCPVRTLAVGTTVSATLAVGDCASGGALRHVYTMNLAAGNSAFTLIYRAGFMTNLAIRGTNPPGPVFGTNGDLVQQVRVLSSTPVEVYASTAASGVAGPYTLQAARTAEDASACDRPWIVSPISTAQSLSTSDCTGAGRFEDSFYFSIPAGGSVIASATTSAFPPLLQLFRFGASQALVTATDTANLALIADTLPPNAANGGVFFVKVTSGPRTVTTPDPSRPGVSVTSPDTSHAVGGYALQVVVSGPPGQVASVRAAGSGRRLWSDAIFPGISMLPEAAVARQGAGSARLRKQQGPDGRSGR